MRLPRWPRPWVCFATGVVTLLLGSFALLGCQVNYILGSAVSQAELLMKRVPMEEALKDATLPESYKNKLRLAEAARKFAEKELGLAETRNYTSFVQLDRPYVTYVVSAAPRTELTPFLWKYPLVGHLPYRGYFNEGAAKAESENLKKDGLDTYVRGVSAYSTLGWFRDPILSSMLAYKDHDLVNTIIHETVHATIYIKSEADFNERLATFIGNKGTEMYYAKVEGESSPTLARIRKENEDDKLFSVFITTEMAKLSEWYKEREGREISETDRQQRLAEIRNRFLVELRPKMSEGSYHSFEKGEINNARLLTYKLYFEDLSDFEAMFKKLGSDFKAFLAFCRTLEKQKEPEKFLATQIRGQDVSGEPAR